MIRKISNFFSKVQCAQNSLPIGEPVILRYWENKKQGGHVALKLPPCGNIKHEVYISFAYSRSMTQYGFTSQGIFIHESRDNNINETGWLAERNGYKPMQEVKLYSLDVSAMYALLEKFTRSDRFKKVGDSFIPDASSETLRWHKLGSFIDTCCYDQDVHNCSSICYALLKAGGVSKLLPYNTRAIYLSVVAVIVFAALGFFAGYLYDRKVNHHKKIDKDEGIFTGVGIGMALLGIAVVYASGYAIFCSIKGVDHVSRPSGIYALVTNAEKREKSLFSNHPSITAPSESTSLINHLEV